MEHFSNMELFRKHPSLCSLFLLALEDWGASRVDWNLLNDEEFADLFLRKLCTSSDVEEDARLKACSLLLQPSPGGLLAAAALHRAGILVGEDFSEFAAFTLKGSANGWKPLDWSELTEVLEDVAFSSDTVEPGWNLASMMSRGWIARDNQSRFFRRVWQTCRIGIDEKKNFFQWLYGQHQWGDLPKAPSSYPDEVFSLKVAYRLSSARRPYSSRRQGHFRRRAQRFG
ncbi:MAG: hypothetical protein KC800_05165 [Candidatus Eremiobacteraeota bacterium]|nr:hypothetical protein [Candidatus Eremiobacteraeota bacterium]